MYSPLARHVLDVPDEVLSRVIDLLEDDDPALQNCRLVNTRFCAISSRSFIRSVSVGYSYESIRRLETIATHPVFSKGPRSIRVVMHCHHLHNPPRQQTFDFDNFAGWHWPELLREAEKLEEDAPWAANGVTDEHGRNARRTLALAGYMLRYRQSVLVHENEAFFSTIRSAYETCQKLFREQEELFAEGRFPQRVAAAMAKMPRVRALHFFGNKASTKKHWLFHYDDVHESIFRHLVKPIDYRNAFYENMILPHSDAIISIPTALAQAGCQLDQISIDLPKLALDHSASQEKTCDLIKLPHQASQDLYPVVRQLKKLSLIFEGPKNGFDDDDPEFCMPLRRILALYLQSSSLQELTIDLFDDCAPQSAEFNVGELLSSTVHQWQNLSLLVIRQVHFRLKDLERLVETISPSSPSLTLDRVCLRGGNWKKALLVFGESSIREVRLSKLSGAEFSPYYDLTDHQVLRQFTKSVTVPRNVTLIS